MPLSASLRELQSLSGRQWLDRASKSAPQIICIVLVIAIAWQLVQLTWMLLERSADQSAPQPIPPYTGPQVAQNRGIDVDAIVRARLFGVPAVEAPSEAADAPETQMSLVLSAVFAADDPAKGLAIIGESAQSAKVFTVGSAVRPGAKLHAVYPDRVVLERNGRLETLALPRPTMANLAINRPAAPPPSANRFADNLRQLAETNPTAFAQIVRPQPVFANGVQRGYRVYPGRNRQQFAKLGLQPGDLVLAINGTPLDDPQRGMEIFNTMGVSDRVNVTIERNGQAQELTLNTAQITLPDPNTNTPRGQQGVRPAPGRTAEIPVE